MRSTRTIGFALLLFAVAISGTAWAQQGPQFTLGGTVYTKWLWGNQRNQGAMYNFTTVPGEGYGDNGQGTEVELLLNARTSKYVQVSARIHSRFSQNFWTNFGGFGGSNTATDCTAGACGEFDPRSNQYVKLRGVTVVLTPGYSWLDSATIGSSDWGMFDPYVVGRIRYIDRDNGQGLLFQGSAIGKSLTWDAARISLPKLWAGPAYGTGDFHTADGAYVGQFKYSGGSMWDIGGLAQWINDIEVDTADQNWDNGRSTRTRFRNTVIGAKVGVHPSATFDARAAYYYSTYESAPALGAPANFGMNGYSPVPAGAHTDWSGKLNLDVTNLGGSGFGVNVEAFSIGAEYASMMAARRESDVLLTEGHDATWALTGPANATYGVFGGNPTRIGYGGWEGNAQQVATINVDNEFTDFDEPMAETSIGWRGITLTPTFQAGALDLAAEYTYLTYDTNWQAWGDDSRSITNTDYPAMDQSVGMGSFRSAYAPFQDKTTNIALIKGKYVIDAGKGIDVFGKIKYIGETDKRLNDARYLPYQAGDCATTGTLGCKNVKNNYSGTNSTGDYYGNPGVITGANGQQGYQWKPFSDVSDDDRDLSYLMFQLGAGYQWTKDLYASLQYIHYTADLQDGNTAFQAYNLQEMASGKHQKNQLIAKFRYSLGGINECGLTYEYNFGTFEPDFGPGFVATKADESTSNNVHVPVGSLGFAGRYGNWNSLEKREFDQQRLKAYIKIGF
jgi:hypothetical protein